MTIKARIEDYKSKVKNFHNASDDAAIWLFLATVGCWGIEEMKFRIAGFFVIFLLFIYQLIKFKNNNNIYKRFDDEITELIHEINTIPNLENYKDELLHFKKENFGWFGLIKKGGVFIICILYSYYSFIYQLSHLST